MVVFKQAQGIIFDLDGTLANTMPTHYLAWKHTLAAYNVAFTEQLFYDWAGRSGIKIVEALNQMYGTCMVPAKVDHDKEQHFLQHISTIKAIEPVLEIAKKYHNKLPISIGTGGIPDVVEQTLHAIGARHLFDIIVTSKDVLKTKPAPDTFLLCAKQMGIVPQFCQVFEDADFGVQAAKAAGMMVVDVRNFL